MKWLLPLFLLLFISAPVLAASPTMGVFYSFPVEMEINVSHYQLFIDDVASCVTSDATVRDFTCTTELENRDYNITLKAIGADGYPDSNPSNIVVINPPDKYFVDTDAPVLIEIRFMDAV